MLLHLTVGYNLSMLSTPLQYFKGIGPKRARLLQKAGIEKPQDLLYYFPRKYEDRSKIIPISKIEIGQVVVVKAKVLSAHLRRSFNRIGLASGGKKGLNIFEAAVGDGTGRIFCVWFNQPYLRNYFKIGVSVILCGKVELYKNRIQMSSPEFEIIEDNEDVLDAGSSDALGAGKILPIYSLPEGISQKVFRKIVSSVLDKLIPQVSEILPFDIRSKYKLLNLAQSLRNIHFPQNQELRLAAYQRLSFEEFFIYQIPLILRKLKRREKKGIAFRIDENSLSDFIKSLPFEFTESQKIVISEIREDMKLARPMQRLLQGDVGCGKTVVAAVAALIAVGNGYQAAFMAPTEILANQHYEKLKIQFLTFRPQSTVYGPQKNIKVGLLTSSLKNKERAKILDDVKSGEIDIIIGTHSLIQGEIKFKKLGLIIIDEQHKFGVSQRALLPEKGINPDVLIMTATPIPRTLSMTLFGDLDISVIRELPFGRKKIQTFYYEPEKKNEAYDFLRSKVKEGRQAYVVYPIIEETEKLVLSSAKKMYEEFSKDIFKEFKVGLIHGKLARKEQDKVMKSFRDGDLDILVATTILEVGIDVPNAAIMLIEHADRFGLSQLHQMRGRIGRGEHDSFCLLVSSPQTEDAMSRINVLVEHSDGFRVAEEDLKIRGPGEFFGERQHGLTELKIADPLRQMHILKAAREEATRLLDNDPRLEQRQNQEIKNQLYKRFPEFEKFIEVG